MNDSFMFTCYKIPSDSGIVIPMVGDGGLVLMVAGFQL